MAVPRHLRSYLKPIEVNSEIHSIKFWPSTSDLVIETPCVASEENKGMICLLCLRELF